MAGQKGIGTVVVLGGGGFYGRYVVADLLAFTDVKVIVASRNPPGEMVGGRVETAVCDLNKLPALIKLCQVADLIIHCAGPFQYMPINPLLAAIETGTDYIDIGEDRLFAQRVAQQRQAIMEAGITVLSGLSVAPALEALAAQLLLPHFDRLHSVRTFAAPDTKKHRGVAMFHTMLLGVGRPFQQLREGEEVTVHGWTEPEWVDFPAPIGRRLTHLVLEMSDLDLLPAYFNVKTVEFKAGTEFSFLNRLLNIAALLRAKTGYPAWEKLTPLVRAFSWLVGRWGQDNGGVFFEVVGWRGGEKVMYRWGIMAEKDGGLIPSILAAIAAEKLWDGSLMTKGLLPHHDWLDREELVKRLRARGLRLWWQTPERPEWHGYEEGIV